MINGKKVIAIIPARGGSKGISNKNIRSLANKPLIFYTIQSAQKCKYIDKILVSTDSKKIANISQRYGNYIPFLRPKRYSNDTAKTIDAIIYSLKKIKEKFDIVILLQPTSPFRDFNDINCALESFVSVKKSLASVNQINLNPYLIRQINSNNTLSKIIEKNSTIRRQDIGHFFKVNGAIYINFVEKLNSSTSLNDNEMPYVMSETHSLDIDSIDDLKKARRIINSKKNVL